VSILPKVSNNLEINEEKRDNEARSIPVSFGKRERGLCAECSQFSLLMLLFCISAEQRSTPAPGPCFWLKLINVVKPLGFRP